MIFIFEYTVKNIVTEEMYRLTYVAILIPWMLISIFGLYSKTKNLQLIAVSLLLFSYSFNSSFTLLESSAIVK